MGFLPVVRYAERFGPSAPMSADAPELDHASGLDELASRILDATQSVLGRPSEELNRSLLDGSPDCVKVLDLDGRLLQMNAPGVCLMEIDDFGLVRGQEWSALWPAEARQDIERAVAAARKGDGYSFQAFCPTAKGTPRWWDVMVSPIRGWANGPVVRLLSVSRDVTERKHTEDARTQSQQRLLLASHAAEIGFWSWQPRLVTGLGTAIDSEVIREVAKLR